MLRLNDLVLCALPDRRIPVDPLLARVGHKGLGVGDDACLGRSGKVPRLRVLEPTADVGQRLIERILLVRLNRESINNCYSSRVTAFVIEQLCALVAYALNALNPVT
jgi:hypothetical protein